MKQMTMFPQPELITLTSVGPGTVFRVLSPTTKNQASDMFVRVEINDSIRWELKDVCRAATQLVMNLRTGTVYPMRPDVAIIPCMNAVVLEDEKILRDGR